jgi:putative SOS response-associated peptidase YedK
MCGRYKLVRLAEFTKLYPWILPFDGDVPQRYNIAPTQAVAVVPNLAQPKIDYYQWGLIPSWAKDPKVGNRMINARAESLAEKASFRTALRRRRCLIPADGFYEWKVNHDGRAKTPMHVRLKGGRPFAFAGLWETWHDPGGSVVPSCVIITTSPNALMKGIHDRMPAIVREDQYRDWLNPKETDAEEFLRLLAPYPSEEMEALPVSRAVNNPRNEGPSCIDGITSDSMNEGEGG